VTSADRPTRSSRAALVLVLLGGLAVVALALLGVWQVQRRAWKLDLIAQVDARIHAPAVDAPGPAAWASIDAAHDAYRRVRAEGVWLNDRETLVQAATALGSGYWVMAPLQTEDGFIVLVNRGFVPPEHADPHRHGVSQPTARAQVTGLLRLTEPKGGFLQANDPATDHWHSRDVAAIAQKRGLANVAPYFIDADATPGDPDQPVGGLTVIDFPNNHLVYALTWFALAGMAAVGTGFVARDAWKAR
jgi:surfeit locus 1 family protein